MTCKEKLQQCRKEGRAILATNFYNYETLKGLMEAAKESDSSLILQSSESTLHYLGIHPAVALARSMLKEYNVTGWLHLDHGSSTDSVKECLDAGYDSVMIDGSEKPLRENIKMTREVVKIAQKYNANVEGELGYIAKLGQQQSVEPTSADDAKRFVEETGVDALAVAIGNAHGFYKNPPRLRFDRLSEIRSVTDCVLVLHGSSGIPDKQIQIAIQQGISKINLATETKNIFMNTLQKTLKDNTEIDLRKVFPVATEAVKTLISQKLAVVNFEHKKNQKAL